jgi:hypothetical protein
MAWESSLCNEIIKNDRGPASSVEGQEPKVWGEESLLLLS